MAYLQPLECVLPERFLEKCRINKLTGLSSSFDTIAYRVSLKTIKFMNQEVKRNEESIHEKESICGCYFQRKYGLPWAHKLGEYLGSEVDIPFTSIHDLWKNLDIEMTLDVEYIDYDEDTYTRVCEDPLNAPRPIRKILFQNLREGLYPNSADIKEPNIIQSKG
ncbi:hypothetical protein LIER_35770 [Lithospermum erythrorhizon]|uniref:Uncharacterized protein n=1 Tax=Lithospermum erythrorhizon TaxID=34254 RepID=A0AAV3NWH7_LITER